jgi:hypothetical protein
LYQASISLAASRYFSLDSVRCFRVTTFMGSRSAALEYFAFCKAARKTLHFAKFRLFSF